jgi:hypothetical protein
MTNHSPTPPSRPSSRSPNRTATAHEPWYKYGVAVLFLEMVIAVAVCGYSLYMAFNGLGGFPGKH